MKVNVGTIGHIDHGKTTLTAALIRVLGEKAAKQVVVVGESHAEELIALTAPETLICEQPCALRARMGKGEKRRQKKMRGW